MMKTPRPLLRLCLDLAALAVLAAAASAIIAFHLLGGFGTTLSRQMLWVCLAAPIASTLPILLYAALRLFRLERENDHLLHIATRDGLTQVLNRSAFKRAAQVELARLGDGGSEVATLLIIDADHFKRINDRLGHGTGDEALSLIAATLRQSVRKDDLVGRLGGEEFAVLLRNAGYEEAQVVAERLRARINMLEVGPRNRRTRLSVSLGGIAFRTAVPFDALYKIADTNLYKAKSAGRNRVTLSQLGSLRSVEGGVGRQIEGTARRWG